jgi:hypothetical protein
MLDVKLFIHFEENMRSEERDSNISFEKICVMNRLIIFNIHLIVSCHQVMEDAN